MHKYNKVLSYIDYFYTTGEEAGTLVSEPYVYPYVNYTPEMMSIIDEA